MSNPTNISSGLLTADATVKTGRGILSGAQIITNGSDNVTLILYDNVSASGKVIFKQIVTGTDNAIPYWFSGGGVQVENGIFADVAGTGAEYIVYYR